MYSLKGGDRTATAACQRGRCDRVGPWVVLVFTLGFLMSASFVNADSTTVRVPLLVIEDLIKAGKFTEADSAFGEWRRSGDSAPRVAELEQTLASTRAAASSLALAQTKAEISTTRASTPNSSHP